MQQNLTEFEQAKNQKQLSLAGEFLVLVFQNKRWYSAATQTGIGAIPFPATLEKLTFEMVNMNFEELNNLWGVLGGAYFPSIVYKVRMVKVQLDDIEAAPEITSIQLDTVIR